MGYSARRGFTNGSMKMTGAQRQAEMQARIQQMQEQVNAAQEAVEAQEFTASVGGGRAKPAQRVHGAAGRYHQTGGRGPGGCGDAPGPGGIRCK